MDVDGLVEDINEEEVVPFVESASFSSYIALRKFQVLTFILKYFKSF